MGERSAVDFKRYFDDQSLFLIVCLVAETQKIATIDAHDVDVDADNGDDDEEIADLIAAIARLTDEIAADGLCQEASLCGATSVVPLAVAELHGHKTTSNKPANNRKSAKDRHQRGQKIN